jgi:hypothetical protein
MIHYSDHLEEMLHNALKEAGIEAIHESEGAILDFYLPKYETYIEVKQYHSDRIAKQMTKADNIIVLQGKKSVELFIKLLKPNQ